MDCDKKEECAFVWEERDARCRAETELRSREYEFTETKAEYERKRTVMNELYLAGVAMMTAKETYNKNRSVEMLDRMTETEKRFGRAIQACKDLAKQRQEVML